MWSCDSKEPKANMKAENGPLVDNCPQEGLYAVPLERVMGSI